jgi:hypothetical protein
MITSPMPQDSPGSSVGQLGTKIDGTQAIRMPYRFIKRSNELL